MATVTGATKKEHDKKEMAKRSGNKHDSDKPKFKFPHYNIGDIVKMSHGHMKVTDLQNDKHAQMYHGVNVNEYGETPENESSFGRGAMHSEVGTGHHSLYARLGDYPTKVDNENPSNKDESK